MTRISCRQLTRSILHKHINPPLQIRLKRNSCKEPTEDCCGNPIQKFVPKPNVVVEKDCTPCYFYTWKPKIPELNCAKSTPKVQIKYEKRKCYAGMTSGKKSLAELKEEAKQCYKKCAIKPGCPETFKMLKKLENEEKQKDEGSFKKCVPVADWDHDGHMD